MARWLGLPGFKRVFRKVAKDLGLQTSRSGLFQSIIV